MSDDAIPPGISAWEVHKKRVLDRAIARIEAKRKAALYSQGVIDAERRQIPVTRSVNPVADQLEALRTQVGPQKRVGLLAFLRW